MRKKLAIGWFCAVLCGLNLVYTRSLQSAETGNCYAYMCEKDTQCRYEVTCAGCAIIYPALGLGYCYPYM